MKFFGQDLELFVYIVYLCRISLSFTGIVLNLLNIIVLCVSSTKISPIGRLVINLAVADISVCVCDIWSIVQDFVISENDWISRFCAATFYTFLQISSFMVTLLAVVLIAINNYLMVIKPLYYSTLVTSPCICRSAAVMWISAIVLTAMAVVLPGGIQTDSSLAKHFEFRKGRIFESLEIENKSEAAFLAGLNITSGDTSRLSGINIMNDIHIHPNATRESDNQSDVQISLFRNDDTDLYDDLFDSEMNIYLNYLNSTHPASICFKLYYSFYFNPYYIFTIGTFISILILLFTYCRMCCEICQLSKRSYRMTGHGISQRKSSITTCFIILSFLICWLPGSFILSMFAYFPGSDNGVASVGMANTMFILQVVNAIIDPVLYALRLPEVRHCYRDIFKSCRK